MTALSLSAQFPLLLVLCACLILPSLTLLLLDAVGALAFASGSLVETPPLEPLDLLERQVRRPTRDMGFTHLFALLDRLRSAAMGSADCRPLLS